ncbi:MAG: MATE family efflux transporter [Bacillota bacterium]
MASLEQGEQRREHMLMDPVGKLIPAVALPSIISMLVGAIYNMADTFFVGKLGNSATGAVGIVFPIMNLLQALAFMFAHGATSYVSRLLGKGDVENASRTVSTAAISALLLGALYGAVGILFLHPLLAFFGATPTILPYAGKYALYIYIASPLFAASYVFNNTLRAEGSPVLALVGMSSGAVLNIILDPICIFALNMGVAGAGFATMIGQIVGFSMLLSFYLRKKGRVSALTLSFKLFTPTKPMMGEILRIGIPSFIRSGMNSVAAIMLNTAAAPYGDAAIAAFSVVTRILFLVNAALIGYGQGYQPISGFNYGAGRFDRVRKAFWFTIESAMVAMVLFAAILIVFAPQMVGIFRNDPDVLGVGVQALRWQAATLPLMGASLLASMLFQSTGHAMPAFVISLARQGLCFVPFILLLPALYGEKGLVAAQSAADIVAFLITIPLLLRVLKHLKDEPGKEPIGELDTIE